MPSTREKTAKTWHITSFTFPSADRCMCYRRRTHSGNPRRCTSGQCSVGLTDPERRNRGFRKLFCLDCWMRCRDELTTTHPHILQMVEEQRRNGLGLIAIGC